MTKIDELLEMNGIAEKIVENERLMQEYLKKFAKTLYPGEEGVHFNTTMYYVDIFNSFMAMVNTDLIDPADIEQYKKCATEYTQLNERLENFQEGKHLSVFDFYEYKTQFLNNLVSTQHIRDVGEEPKEFFKKLIELYGEDKLADFVYREDYDEVDDFSYDVFTISDFVFGEEDKVIELTSNENLRKVLLASKLKYLHENGVDITKYIQEYVDAATKHGISNLVYLDEYEEVDLETTLSEFARLPISQDRNFYLYLAKHLDEMGVKFETLLDYIDPNMIDEEFGPTLAHVKNTKQYDEYQKMTQKEEHTAEEIGEGIGDLTQSEVGEALNTVTDIGEPQKDPKKDPHNLE